MKAHVNLHADEKILFECRPKKALMAYIYLTKGFQVFIVGPILLCLLYYFFLNAPSSSMGSLFQTSLFAFVGIFAAVNLIAYAWLSYVIKRHWYYFTNLRCIVYSGYWGVNKKIVPYNRIVDINMNRNPLRAILGLSAIYIVQQGIASAYSQGMGGNTQGISANMTIIDGLSPELADKITSLVSQQMSIAK